MLQSSFAQKFAALFERHRLKLTVERCTQEIRGGTACIKIDELLGRPGVLFVDKDSVAFYGDFLYIEQGRFVVRKNAGLIKSFAVNQSLAHLIAAVNQDYYSVQLRNPPVILEGVEYHDYRLTNLEIRQTQEQKAAEAHSRAEVQREELGALTLTAKAEFGLRSNQGAGELTAEQARAELLRSHFAPRNPYAYHLRTHQVGGHAVSQLDGDVADLAGFEPAKRVKPTGTAPDSEE